MRFQNFIFISIFCFITNQIFAQLVPTRIDSFPIFKQSSSNLYKYPLGAGLNSVQAISFDLNNDNQDDLILFDRVGNVLLTFLNDKSLSSNPFYYRPEFEKFFPKMHSWVRMYDYNCDGKKDIFTSDNDMVKVYKNTSTSSTIEFELVKDSLSHIVSGVLDGIFIKNVDLPDMNDVDSDGDLDLFTFDESGSYMQFYKNLSIEQGFLCDSLIFQLDVSCWGQFIEPTLSSYCELDAACRTANPNLFKENDAFHPGSTTLTFDYEDNGTLDLLLGDITSNSMNLLINDGPPLAAHIASQDTSFPNNPSSIKCYTFPAAFKIDCNNDTIYDLLVSSNSDLNNHNHKPLQWYKNSGTNQAPVFELITESFLADEMIDFGEGAYPAMRDINADGKKDLIFGNNQYYIPPGSNNQARLAYLKYQEIGSQSSFKVMNLDWLNTSALPVATDFYESLIPTFGDLDGDGDDDLLVGEYNGKLLHYRNIASAGMPDSFVLITTNFESIDVGQAAAPQLVDVDRDSKIDLLIGERNGNINYYRNTGTSSTPMFTLVTDTFGGVNVKAPLSVTGYSTPHLFTIDSVNQKYALLVGSETGKLFYFTNIDENLNSVFPEDLTTYAGVNIGKRTAPFIGNIDMDPANELIVGNFRGGIHFYNFALPSSITESNSSNFDFNIFPNPASKNVNIQLSDTHLFDIEIYTILGQMVFSSSNLSNNINVPIENWSKGMYIVRVFSQNKFSSKKLLID